MQDLIMFGAFDQLCHSASKQASRLVLHHCADHYGARERWWRTGTRAAVVPGVESGVSKQMGGDWSNGSKRVPLKLRIVWTINKINAGADH